MIPLWLIIHHTATDRDTTTFSGVKNYHISKGWGDIGYHYFITPSRCYTGRPETVVGAHCRADGMNFKSLGICLAGNFQTQQPTDWQVERLNKLVKDLQRRYNIPNSNILGHREVDGASTACPGNNLMPHVVAMRGGETMSDMYKGLDLSNKESMKVAVDVWKDVMDKKYVKSEELEKLQKTTKIRIEKEEQRYKDFVFEINKLLNVGKDEPKILEAIRELLVVEEQEESGEVELETPGHSRICNMLAKIGL